MLGSKDKQRKLWHTNQRTLLHHVTQRTQLLGQNG